MSDTYIEDALRLVLMSFDNLVALLPQIDLGADGSDCPIRPDGLDENDEKPGIAIQVRREEFSKQLAGMSPLADSEVVLRVLAPTRRAARAIAIAIQHNATPETDERNKGLGGLKNHEIGGFKIQSATLTERLSYVSALDDKSDQLTYVIDCYYELHYIDKVYSLP